MTGMDEPRDKTVVKRDGRDVILCERGEISLERDKAGIIQEWECELAEPTEQQVEEGFWMVRVILTRLLNGVGTTGTRLAIAARLSRLAAEVRTGGLWVRAPGGCMTKKEAIR
jgi:hypothetical protein